jgi:hypothetical protein
MINDTRSSRFTGYEVGYRRPPRKNQFKKGQPSPNPKGRPRGSKNVDLVQVLKEPVTLKIGGRTRKVPYLEAWMQVIKEKALKGDIKASQVLILVAKTLKMLNTDDILGDEDFEFTVSLNTTKTSPFLTRPANGADD